MDSLTQIVLGAATGEVVLGRKLGNRAMVWGAIAGTIPDLDVMVGHFLYDPLGSLAFHRGISHSIFFAITFSFLMAYLVRQYYIKELDKKQNWRIAGKIFATLFVILLTGLFTLIGFVIGKTLGAVLMFLPSAIVGFHFIKRSWQGLSTQYDMARDVTYKEWYWFFFWSIFTHPILDCFTTYGTQLFQPFSDYRVSWDNISVADPIYTLVFGIFVLIASHYHRSDFKRLKFTYIGIALATLYMDWTFINKQKVNQILEHSLTKDNISYSRYITSPTILNNILWSGVADADTNFYMGQYSLFDKEPYFKLRKVPKQLYLIDKQKYEEDQTLKVLRWFSKDYCAILSRQDGRLQVNDMRYGLFDADAQLDENNSIFRFVLDEESGKYKLSESDGGPPKGSEQEMFPRLWNRILGK